MDRDERELGAIWPMPDRDHEGVERSRVLRIRPATQSLHRPRRVAKRRPAWLAFLLTLVGTRG
jgi:hypothetical protein